MTTRMLLLLICVIAGAPVWGQVVSVKQAPTVTAVEGRDLFLARNVLRNFFESERHPECYRVLFSEFERNLRVDFVPKNRTIVLEEGQEDSSEPSCGRNIGYIIDKKGVVLRRIYSR